MNKLFSFHTQRIWPWCLFFRLFCDPKKIKNKISGFSNILPKSSRARKKPPPPLMKIGVCFSGILVTPHWWILVYFFRHFCDPSLMIIGYVFQAFWLPHIDVFWCVFFRHFCDSAWMNIGYVFHAFLWPCTDEFWVCFFQAFWLPCVDDWLASSSMWQETRSHPRGERKAVLVNIVPFVVSEENNLEAKWVKHQ